jgi:hypothetical protein
MLVPARYIQTLILAAAIVVASTFSRTTSSAEFDASASATTSATFTVGPAHEQSWTNHSSAMPRLGSFATNFQPTLEMVPQAPEFRLETGQESVQRIDVRHRIQRIERLLLRI